MITNPSEINRDSLLCGLLTLAIAFGLGRTRIRSYAAIVALVVPTLLVLNVDGIERVEDVGAIPGGLPMPHVPDLSLFFSFHIWTGALAVAAIVLVQGAGVAEAAPNSDGSRSSMNRDFIAQGVGNVASGLFRGQPVGGSVGATALNVASGAVTRWASILAGIWMLTILLLFSGQVGKVVMPTLAGLLIYAAVGSLRIAEIRTILRTGTTSQIGFTTTFLATLFLPVAAAVGIGVALSLLLQLNKEALDLSVVELVRRPDGRFAEQPAPERLPSRSVTVLDIYGSLYYAGAKTLEARLPDPAGSVAPVVVLRLRGRTALGATGFAVLAGYAEAAGRGRRPAVPERRRSDPDRAGAAKPPGGRDRPGARVRGDRADRRVDRAGRRARRGLAHPRGTVSPGFAAAAFPGKHEAERALDALEELQHEDVVSLADAVIVVKTAKGVKLHQQRQVSIGEGVVAGGVLGVIVGLLIGMPGDRADRGDGLRRRGRSLLRLGHRRCADARARRRPRARHRRRCASRWPRRTGMSSASGWSGTRRI